MTARFAIDGWRHSPRNRFLILLAAAAILTVAVLLEPVTTRTVSASGAVRENRCGITYYLLGHSSAPEVTASCRDAFVGHAYGAFLAAVVALAGLTGLARAMMVERRRVAPSSPISAPEPANVAPKPADVATPGRPTLGSAENLGAAVRSAATMRPVRWLTALALPIVALLPIVARPVHIISSDGTEVRDNVCGFTFQLFGADEPTVTRACREAYRGRFTATVVLTIALLAIGIALLRVIEYLRGRRLSYQWDNDDSASLFVQKVGAGCSAAMIIAALLAVHPHPTSLPPILSASSPAVIPPSQTQPPRSAPPPPSPSRPPSYQVADPLPYTPSLPRTTASPSDRPSSAPPAALRIVDTAWFGSRPNIIDTFTIPAGALPVAVTGGAHDKHAYFRVRGTATTLVLRLSSDPFANRFTNVAKVNVCPVRTAAWTHVEGGNLQDAPAYDELGCVELRVQGDLWSVDVGRWPDRGGARGFVLVPADLSQDFQVTFVP